MKEFEESEPPTFDDAPKDTPSSLVPPRPSDPSCKQALLAIGMTETPTAATPP